MNLLRQIKQIFINSGVVSNYLQWKLGTQEVVDKVPVLFQSGCIGINSKAKLWISKFQAKNYAFIVNDYSDLITKYSLQDGDYFYGFEDNYIIFRSSGDIFIKTKDLNIESQNINITLTDKIIVNGINLAFSGSKFTINNKEIAVVGGDVNPSTNKITVSGQ